MFTGTFYATNGHSLGTSQKWVRVSEYKPVWDINRCHTNYAIPSIKGGWLVWAVYGNSPVELGALRKYMRLSDKSSKGENP